MSMAPGKQRECDCCHNTFSTIYLQKKGNSFFCSNCYQALLRKAAKLEALKSELYNYIKDLYQVNELPDSVLANLDILFNKGYKPIGIKETLRYYYYILGKSNVFNIDYINSIVYGFYNEAKAYREQQKLLKAKNMQIDINTSQQTIKMVAPKPHLDKQRNFNMEDL